MAKKEVALIKLEVKAGSATPAYPVGPALGPHGVNIMAFVKEFNAATARQSGAIIPVEITVYADRSFTFVAKTPTTSSLIRKALGIPKGSEEPNKVKVGTLTWEQCLDIGRLKMPDLSEMAAAKTVAGTARSMGVNVNGKPDTTA